MTQEIETIYLCLLDNLNLKEEINLGEFSIRKYSLNELASLLQGRDDCDKSAEYRAQIKSYSEFPWARLDEVPRINNSFHALLHHDNLLLMHTGEASWAPFTEMIRTLNLLKQSDGPVFGRHFYHRPVPHIQTAAQIRKIIYSEPYEELDENGNPINYLSGYELDANDQSNFNVLREQLKKCLSKDSVDNAYLKIAIHLFENADRKLTPYPLLPGSFNAIDPLMSNEASLEALMIFEKDSNISKLLAKRIPSAIKEDPKIIGEFVKHVHRLRSKFAHGVMSVYEIENHIVNRTNIIINGITVGKDDRLLYDRLLMEGNYFLGFLVNLREITRRCIRFFCDEHIQGHSRDEIIQNL